ncbi:DUF1344 domain-containing protein [Salmonella enterica subsp. enterica]|nr:hypothetical protein [Salmonella enterica subsp. enterica serovar Newport]ECI7686003.1 DUF1344 domain-containing protein [Salmonella enterica subsp. enterica serovar Paratyphi A]
MRTLLASAALAASMALAPAAFAASAQTSTGSIKTYDAKAHSITLDDGTTYMLPAKFKASGLKAGEKVQVSWTMTNGAYDATAVKILK